MSDERPHYFIADPRPIAAGAPYTFFLPSAAEIAAIGVGDLVKLMFEYEHQTEKWGGERMWVKVGGYEGERLWGSLANEPDEPTSFLRHGEKIEFQRHHALAIVWENPEAAPKQENYREYWDRCLVDDCVLDGSEPVEYFYREEPEMAQDGDNYPDSGWRIRGRQGDATDEEMENRKLSYVALGAVLNRDDSWLSHIDAPIGSAFMRNFETGNYELSG